MNSNVRGIVGLMLGVVSLFFWPLPAQSQQPRFYGWLDAGGTVVQDTKLKSFFDQPVSGNVKFDPGFRFGLGAGCEFHRYLAAELETGFSWNSVSQFDGINGLDAALYQVPILVNLILQYPIEMRNRSKLVPMIGAGVGGAALTLDMSSDFEPGFGSASSFVFAYQGMAGLRYEVNRNMSIGVNYRFFIADSPDFESHEPEGFIPPPGGPPLEGHITMESLRTHVVTLGVQWRF